MVTDGKKGIGAGDKEQELEELFASYVDRLNRGDELNPQEILAKHPLVGEQLLACLEDYIGADTAPISMQLQTLGDYTLRRQIGRGGMGVVYDAWQNSLDRQVALKVLPVGVAADDRTFHRFMREAKTAARLNHENVVRVYGMGVESNTPYFAMEYVDGKTLGQLLAKPETDTDEVIDPPFGRTKEGLVDYPRIATAFADMADGLHHAHSKGVIHRDIKPSNLILDGAGRLRILDFGLARLEGQAGLTLTHDVLGTPLYMSPEQARRRKIPIDHRTDIYSLGATLYEMLTKSPPFRGRDNQETLSQIIEKDPSPLRRFDPNIPKSLETIVLKCLRKNPKDRYDTADAVAEDLRRFARGEPVEAQPLPPWAGVTRRAWKHSPRIGVIVMAATLVVLLVSLLMPTKEMVTRQVWAPALDISGSPSLDGRYLSFTDWSTGDLAVHDLTTGEKRLLTNKVSWSVSEEFADMSHMSPDGKQVVYTWYNGESLELRVVGLDGSKPRILHRAEIGEYPAGWWTADGMVVAAFFGKRLDRTTDVLLISVADGSTRLLKTYTGPLRIGWSSPDGRYVALSRPRGEDSPQHDIFLLATDGSGEIPLIEHPADDRVLGWSRDGSWLLFRSDRAGSDGAWILRVTGGTAHGAPRLIKSNFGKVTPIGFTQDGSFYYGIRSGTTDAYTAPLDLAQGKGLGSPTPVTDRYVGTTLWPSWSHDGKYLTYVSVPNAFSGGGPSLTIVIRSLETGEERELQPDLRLSVAPWARPSLSPDGKTVLLIGTAEGKGGLYQVDAYSGEVTLLVEGSVWLPAWSSDGKRVFYKRGARLAGSGDALVSRDLGTGQESLVYHADAPRKKIGTFSVSPSGRELAFILNDQATPSQALMVLPSVGGEARELLRVQEPDFISRQAGLAWTPDGREVVFRKNFELWGIPAAGGEPRKLAPIMTLSEVGAADPSSRKPAGLVGLRIHPDGTRMAFTARGETMEVWVMENFLPDKTPS